MAIVTALSDYAAWVTQRAPVAGANEVLQALREAAREFCRYSGVYTKTQTDINVVSGTQSYELTPDTGADITRLVWVKISSAYVGSDQYSLTISSSKYYLTFEENCQPLYDLTAGLDVKFEEAPQLNSATVSQEVLVEHGDGIAWLAVYLLTFDPRRPSANPAMAAEAYDAYRRALVTASHDRQIGRKRGSVTVNTPSWL